MQTENSGKNPLNAYTCQLSQDGVEMNDWTGYNCETLQCIKHF